jgi:hypothetical protein
VEDLFLSPLPRCGRKILKIGSFWELSFIFQKKINIELCSLNPKKDFIKEYEHSFMDLPQNTVEGIIKLSSRK